MWRTQPMLAHIVPILDSYRCSTLSWSAIHKSCCQRWDLQTRISMPSYSVCSGVLSSYLKPNTDESKHARLVSLDPIAEMAGSPWPLGLSIAPLRLSYASDSPRSPGFFRPYSRNSLVQDF